MKIYRQRVSLQNPLCHLTQWTNEMNVWRDILKGLIGWLVGATWSFRQMNLRFSIQNSFSFFDSGGWFGLGWCYHCVMFYLQKFPLTSCFVLFCSFQEIKLCVLVRDLKTSRTDWKIDRSRTSTNQRCPYMLI